MILINDYTPVSPDKYPPTEPVICSHFGCGKTLTMQENLFGKKCIDHPKDQHQDPVKIIKFE
jgi:hypothetical protein